MNRLAVITDSGTSTGFRMAGVDTYEVGTNQQLQAKLAELIKTETYGLIAVNQDLAADMGEEVTRIMKSRALPVILPFPVPKGGTVESGETYLSKLVKDAIGFYVKLK
ncbi:MAG: V-type ATP synthase subunit F, partial [Candidatus Edwardsbacteria bacterium]|nr:V-type ATP synthase subunit F [Candidatus Edwardsbacteria bacterium]